MHLLFPADPDDPRAPDPDFAVEADAARAAGFGMLLFDFDALREGEARRAVSATESAPADSDAPTLALHRGWMMSDAEYESLYETLRERRGWTLAVSPAQYAEAHYLPLAYSHLMPDTPEAVWTTSADIAAAWELYAAWNRPAAIVKDYVKSAKHRWREACFLPAGTDEAHFRQILTTLAEIRRPHFNKGFVLRRFHPLFLMSETMWGQPIHEEYRLFFWCGACLVRAPFADEADFAGGIEAWRTVARRFGSPFVSLDVAREESGGFLLVEAGDGGVSGLPVGVCAEALYDALRRAIA